MFETIKHFEDASGDGLSEESKSESESAYEISSQEPQDYFAWIV